MRSNRLKTKIFFFLKTCKFLAEVMHHVPRIFLFFPCETKSKNKSNIPKLLPHELFFQKMLNKQPSWPSSFGSLEITGWEVDELCPLFPKPQWKKYPRRNSFYLSLFISQDILKKKKKKEVKPSFSKNMDLRVILFCFVCEMFSKKKKEKRKEKRKEKKRKEEENLKFQSCSSVPRTRFTFCSFWTSKDGSFLFLGCDIRYCRSSNHWFPSWPLADEARIELHRFLYKRSINWKLCSSCLEKKRNR